MQALNLQAAYFSVCDEKEKSFLRGYKSVNVHEFILYKLFGNGSHNHPEHESVRVLHAASRALLAEWHPNERRPLECLCGVTESGTSTDGGK